MTNHNTPKDWLRTTISGIAHINPGLLSVPDPTTTISFIAMADLGEGRIVKNNKRPFSEVSRGYTYFNDQDILVAKITPCFENGKGAVACDLHNSIGVGSTEFVVLRPSEQVSPQFLFHLTMLPEFRQRGSATMVGSAGQQRLQSDFIRTFPVDLPPLEEQQRIAAVLELWDHAIGFCSSLLATKLRLKQGLTQQLLTGKRRFRGFENDAIPTTRLHEVLEKVADAVEVDPTRMYQEIGIRSHGKGLFHKEPVMGHILAEKRVYRVVPDCLTLNIVFAWERAIAVTTNREEGMVVSHRFPMFRPNRDRILPEYALMYMLSQPGEEAMQLASPGGAGRNRTLSQTEFLKTPIPLPCIDEQHKIVEFVSIIDLEIETLQRQLAALKEQKKGLMQKLLTGEVRIKGEP